jgi:hypothetical protein
MSRIDDGGGPPSDTWTATDNSPITVDISGLDDFAKLMAGESKDQFAANMQQGIVPMLSVAAPFGGGGLKEGAFYRQIHDEARKAIGGLLSDVSNGLQSLGLAATSIYYEYYTGDTLGKSTVDDVFNAFYPPPGMQTLQQKQQEADKTDPGSTTTTTSTQPPPPHGPGHMHDPDDNAPDYGFGSDYSTTIADGKPGQYVIPGDSDHMGDAPADPMLGN